LTIFVVSYVLSIIFGGILSYIVLTMGWFFRFSFVHFFLLSGLVAWIYAILAAVMRR
jgi:hypothetical protein